MSKKLLPIVVFIFLLSCIASLGFLMKTGENASEIEKLQQSVDEQLKENEQLKNQNLEINFE